MVGTLTSRDHALVLDLQHRIAELQSDVNDFPNTGTLQAEVDALEVTIAALQAENTALESDIGVLEFNVAALQTANTTLNATVVTLTATVTGLEAEIDALQDELGGNVNLISNPSVEAHTTGYEETGNGTFVRSNAGGVPFDGDYGLDVTTANQDSSGVKYETSSAITAGEDHVFSVYARLASAGSKAMYLYIDWYDEDTVFLAEASAQFTLNSTAYARFSVTGAAPVGVSFAQLYVVTDGAVGIFHYYTDGWQLEEGTVPTELHVEGDLASRVATMEALIDPGNASGMLDFGLSGKGNAINTESPSGNAGYDRATDAVYAGGQVKMSTLNDAATIILARMQTEDPGTTTGWPDGRTGVARIDWAVLDKNGDWIHPNGADNAFAADNSNFYLPAGGNPANSWGDRHIQVINELESGVTKPPRTVLRITGENGGEIWGTSYDSSGAVVTDTKLFP